MEFLENVLDVFLNRAPAASENFPDLAIAFARGDPFNNLKLAFSQGARLGKSASRGACVGGVAVPGGHGKIAFS